GGMLTIVALWLVARGERAARRAQITSWVGAGALLGFSGLLKPPLIGAIAVLVTAYVVDAWRRAPSFRGTAARVRSALVASLPVIASAAAGALLPVAACALWFVAKGALGDLVQVLFVFTPHYTALGWADASVIGMLYYGFLDWL